uniref:NADH-ubiquinone oxidoreductase chain 2 n=1 Tax=Onchidella borealis TaxID=244421 RepID=E6Y1D1_9EUPU|nr:NADH dehydrogenase subunit 2 [Onchidella borealis]
MSVSNLIFFSMLVLGPFISLTSCSWILCWVGMEISFLGLIPLLLIGNKTLSKESSMKLFCMQALGSAFILVGGLVVFSLKGLDSFYAVVIMYGLILKLGLFPGHFWVISVLFGLDLVSMSVVLGPLKIPPLLFLSEMMMIYPNMSEFMFALCGITAIQGAILGLNQTNTRAMLAASSIVHAGWLGISCVSGSLWVYFSIYVTSVYFCLSFMWVEDSFSASLSLLSLSGLPPFFMFLAKFSVIQCLLQNLHSPMWLILPLLGSVISLVFYLKFFYSYHISSKRNSNLPGLALGFVILNSGAVWFFFTG